MESEIIKKIHTRFDKDGIEINYPVRGLVYPDGYKVPSAEDPLAVSPESITLEGQNA